MDHLVNLLEAATKRLEVSRDQVRITFEMIEEDGEFTLWVVAYLLCTKRGVLEVGAGSSPHVAIDRLCAKVPS